MSDLPRFETLLVERTGRLLTITLNRPEVMNAFNQVMHHEIADAFAFAGQDGGSDVILVTGAGQAFSAGGDIDRMALILETPDVFDDDVAVARRLIFNLLDIEKPVVARLPGSAVGLGATIALFCDIIFALDTARIGDPHVKVGLVAGDGGAVIWPYLVGMARAKEYLLTGRLLTGAEAAEIGLINHAVPAGDLDARVTACCEELLAGAAPALRGTKAILNLELKRIADLVLDAGLAREAASVRTDEHASAVKAMRSRLNRRGGV